MSTDKENENFEAFKAYYARRRMSFKRYNRMVFDDMVSKPAPPNFEFWVKTGPNNWDTITLVHSQDRWRKEMSMTVDPFTHHYETGEDVKIALDYLRNQFDLLDPGLRYAVDSLTPFLEGGLPREELQYHLSMTGELIWFRLRAMEGLVTLEAPRK